ncbi:MULTISPECIES: hypothetical protein [Flavobacterium]|uniref:Uncharacterized protein n=1 Tax=Flavobacterium jumunjinense TaxID=998845 RepID=A0ABV5GNK5_9FLAO|nr:MULTISPECIES: hypothetical protein [Flavobacterium]
MSINKNSGSEISLSDAVELTKQFQNKFPKEIKASFVGVNSLNLILKQEGCVGIRVYNGYDVDLERFAPVLVGVNAEGNDMTDGVILDKMNPCPQYCDPESPLGGDK